MLNFFLFFFLLSFFRICKKKKEKRNAKKGKKIRESKHFHEREYRFYSSPTWIFHASDLNENRLGDTSKTQLANVFGQNLINFFFYYSSSSFFLFEKSRFDGKRAEKVLHFYTFYVDQADFFLNPRSIETRVDIAERSVLRPLWRCINFLIFVPPLPSPRGIQLAVKVKVANSEHQDWCTKGKLLLPVSLHRVMRSLVKKMTSLFTR